MHKYDLRFKIIIKLIYIFDMQFTGLKGGQRMNGRQPLHSKALDDDNDVDDQAT